MNELDIYKKDCLIKILDLYKKANAGHIGAALSCMVILVYLYFKLMKDHDRFILSKGHEVSFGEKITIVCLGLFVLNAWNAIRKLVDKFLTDLFVVTQMALDNLPLNVIIILRKTNKFLVVEEHISRVGLGENLALVLVRNQIRCQFINRFALGYLEGLYDSQAYHQEKCGLDSTSLATDIQSLLK